MIKGIGSKNREVFEMKEFSLCIRRDEKNKKWEMEGSKPSIDVNWHWYREKLCHLTPPEVQCYRKDECEIRDISNYFWKSNL